MSLRPSKNTTWNVRPAALSPLHNQNSYATCRHSKTTSLFGALPMTAQNTFWSVPCWGAKRSQNGATTVGLAVVGMDSFVLSEKREVVKGPVKFRVPWGLTKRVVKSTPPKG